MITRTKAAETVAAYGFIARTWDLLNAGDRQMIAGSVAGNRRVDAVLPFEREADRVRVLAAYDAVLALHQPVAQAA